MTAFNGDSALKEKLLSLAQSNQLPDETISIASLGIPPEVLALASAIHQGMPAALAKNWPVQFLSAIRPGVDLSRVWLAFAVWLLQDPEFGALKFTYTYARRQAIKQVVTRYQQSVEDADRWAEASAEIKRIWNGSLDTAAGQSMATACHVAEAAVYSLAAARAGDQSEGWRTNWRLTALAVSKASQAAAEALSKWAVQTAAEEAAEEQQLKVVQEPAVPTAESNALPVMSANGDESASDGAADAQARTANIAKRARHAAYLRQAATLMQLLKEEEAVAKPPRADADGDAVNDQQSNVRNPTQPREPTSLFLLRALVFTVACTALFFWIGWGIASPFGGIFVGLFLAEFIGQAISVWNRRRRLTRS